MMIALLWALCLSTPAADRFDFPMRLERANANELPALVLQPELLSPLEPLAQVVLRGAPLADGRRVDLALERADPDTADLVVEVDGVRVPGRFALQGSSWAGKVVGEPDSSVFVGFSPLGSRGWIYSQGEYHHILAQPGADGLWAHSLSRLVSESQLGELGVRPNIDCGMDQLYAPGTIPHPERNPAPQSMATTTTLVCRQAIETDYQLYQDFALDLAAEQTYVAQLLGAENQRYIEQINTVLSTVYLGFHTNSNDGWTSGDTGAGSGAMLGEFQAAWANNLPNGANLATFLSGASLGGGVAWLDTLCNGTYGFAVCGNITLQGGLTPFPVVQGPLTWDFMVLTHEVGHNFGTPHTHDWCPVPLDQCAPNGYFGNCQSSQVCINNGTLMSYCHLCSGGMNNVYPYFHQACADLMRQRAENSCLGNWCSGPASYCTGGVNQTGFPGDIGASGSTSLSVNAFTLTASQLPPNKTGFFFYGPDAVQIPLGNGFRCVGGSQLFRLSPQSSGASGVITRTLDFTQPPFSAGPGQILPGTLWRFQCYYRDTGFGQGFNLTDGLAVPFCP
ncbi:MAG: hypothetical protein IPJ19_19320 [Planctomycetes bacterium]|nr:hypothetical protein [Planctomycetota bacterium]